MNIGHTACMFALKLSFGVTVAVALPGCGAAQAESAAAAKTAVACAATEALYDRLQDELLDAGSCDSYPNARTCPAHIAAREAFVAQKAKLECPR